MVLRPRNGISLCSGGGGLELGLHLAEPGFACRCYVEADADAQAVLVGNMAGDTLDQLYAQLATADLPDRNTTLSQLAAIGGRHARPFEPAAVWPDVRTFVGDAWTGHIDLVSAGYPCQPFSAAGNRAGRDDPRHLWPDVARIYWETGAPWGVFENVAGHISLGLETVLRDIWDMGATPAVGLFSSGETSGAHERQRVVIVAYRSSERRQQIPAGPFGDETPYGRAGRDEREQNRCNQLAGDGNELADAGCGRQDRSSQGQDQQPRGTEAERTSADVGYSARIRRGEGRPEPELRSGRDTPSSAGCELADTSKSGPQGRERAGTPDQRNGPVAHGSASQRGRPFLSPPGPGETAIWGHVLRLAPDLAPSLAIRDLVSRANDLAAMVAEGRVAEAQAQSDLRRMADAMATRTRALRMYGNGVDPLVAAYAWRTLSAAHGLRPLDLATAGGLHRTDTGELIR